MLGDITKNSELITFLECNSLKNFRYIVHLFLLITIKSCIDTIHLRFNLILFSFITYIFL